MGKWVLCTPPIYAQPKPILSLHVSYIPIECMQFVYATA